MKKISVMLVAFITVLALVLPDVSFAASFGGRSSSFGSSSRSSFSSSSSRSYSSPSRSYSSSSSSRSSSFFGGSSSKSSSTKSSSSSSKSSGWSFFGGSSKKSTSKPKTSTSVGTSKSYNSAYKSSAKSTISKGSFSGASSRKSPTYRSGTVYRSTPTRAYYGGHYVTVSHYYHVGYSPFGWGGYYHGFTTGMFMSSLYHPWGGTYYVGGNYASYGPSPIAWIVDVIAFILIVGIILIIVAAMRPRTTFRRKF